MWSEYWWLIIIFIVFIVLIVLLGTVWHNLYPWTNNNHIVGYIAPINESFWEHLKIIIFPVLIFFLFLYVFTYERFGNGGAALFCATIGAIIFITILFYLYTQGNLEKSILWVDILIYVLSIVVAVTIMALILAIPYLNDMINYICIALYILLLFLVFVFTYNPPCDCGFWKIPGN
jgi:hypothetical protein